MTFLRALRLLVLGETWTLPLGVLVVLGLGALLDRVARELWRDAGAVLLVCGVLGVFSASVRRRVR